MSKEGNRKKRESLQALKKERFLSLSDPLSSSIGFGIDYFQLAFPIPIEKENQ